MNGNNGSAREVRDCKFLWQGGKKRVHLEFVNGTEGGREGAGELERVGHRGTYTG